MAGDALEIVGISQAVVAPDGDSVTLSLVDTENSEYDISLGFEALGLSIVKMLGVAEAAGAKRRADGRVPEPEVPDPDTLLPYPVARYALGLSEDKEQIALRFQTEDDLIWDFVMPVDGIARLQNDLARLKALSEQDDQPDGATDPS